MYWAWKKLSIGGTDRANWHSSWLRFSWCFFDFAEKKPFNSVGTFVVIRIGCIVSAAIGINAGHVGNEELLGAVVAALESFSHRFKVYRRNKIVVTKRHIAFVPPFLFFSSLLSSFRSSFLQLLILDDCHTSSLTNFRLSFLLPTFTPSLRSVVLLFSLPRSSSPPFVPFSSNSFVPFSLPLLTRLFRSPILFKQIVLYFLWRKMQRRREGEKTKAHPWDI